MCDKFCQAERTRQQILDLCNQRGRITSREVVDAMGIHGDHANRSLRKMEANGEVKSHGRGNHLFFTPIATKTTSADQMRLRAANRKTQTEIDKSRENLERGMRKSGGSIYVHNGMDREHPLPNQGGQGRVGPRCASSISEVFL